MSDGMFSVAAGAMRALDGDAIAAATARQGLLTKPPGALGALEELGIRLAGMAGVCPPPIPEPVAVAVFAGDHGVVASGVTPWPQDVTAQMAANIAGGGAAINAIARQVGASVHVVDVGVASDISALENVRHEKIALGTADLSVGPAMTADQATAALDVGARVAADLVDRGARCLVTGEMGIGNTTPSAALIAAFTGSTAEKVTGRGTGIDDEMLVHKTAVIADAVARLDDAATPLDILAEVGGLEIAALAGFIVGGAARGVPVIIDGVIACAALLTADALAPGVVEWCIAGHRSTEPGASTALAGLGLDPLIDLSLRLGEGSGGCLAVPLVQTAARVLSEMATFEDAAVSERSE